MNEETNHPRSEEAFTRSRKAEVQARALEGSPPSSLSLTALAQTHTDGTTDKLPGFVCTICASNTA